MATTYSFPATNGHAGHGHTHSHGKKSTPERLPLRPTSTNGGIHVNSGHTLSSDLLKPLAQHQPHKSIDVFQTPNQESFNSNQERPNSLHLPIPSSFSTPTPARSKSMERRKSVGLPTHLRLERNGYGFPSPSSQRFPKIDEQVTKRYSSPVTHDFCLHLADNGSTQWATFNELLNSILLPLPYVLASLAFKSFVAPGNVSNSSTLPSIMAPELPLLLEISALTSLTLVLVGLRGKIGNTSIGGSDKRKKSLTGIEEVQKTQWTHMPRRISARYLTVGLPFYATSKLGGSRVTLVLLTALAADIMVTEEETADFARAKGWRTLLRHSRWALGSILLQLMSDLLGLTGLSGVFDILLGYVTLGLVIFVLPPCFLSSKPKFSVVTSTAPASESKTTAVLATPWETPPELEEKSAKLPAVSPMISSPEDVNLTLYSGITLGIIIAIIFVFSGPSAGSRPEYQFAWSLLSTFATALTLIAVDPRSLREKQFGLVLGSLLSSFVLTMLCSEAWSSFVYQSILIGFSFAATRLDTHKASSISSNSSHHHHHPTRPNLPEHAQMSRFSELIIGQIPHWPLFHSILAEKDSRRIFYFMW